MEKRIGVSVCVMLLLLVVACDTDTNKGDGPTNTGLGGGHGPLQNDISSGMEGVGTAKMDDGRFVAYGINNMVNTIDYCIVKKDRQVRCYVFRGFSDQSGKRREVWMLFSHSLSDAQMCETRDLLRAASVLSMEPIYSGEMADGMQQYLHVWSGENSRSVLFDNVVPKEASALLHNLRSIMERCVSGAQGKEIAFSEVQRQNPFSEYY